MLKLATFTNPVLRSKAGAGFENPAGSVMKEVLDQEVKDNISGGWDSAGLGNKGDACSLTVECMTICNWISWKGACS